MKYVIYAANPQEIERANVLAASIYQHNETAETVLVKRTKDRIPAGLWNEVRDIDGPVDLIAAIESEKDFPATFLHPSLFCVDEFAPPQDEPFIVAYHESGDVFPGLLVINEKTVFIDLLRQVFCHENDGGIASAVEQVIEELGAATPEIIVSTPEPYAPFRASYQAKVGPFISYPFWMPDKRAAAGIRVLVAKMSEEAQVRLTFPLGFYNAPRREFVEKLRPKRLIKKLQNEKNVAPATPDLAPEEPEGLDGAGSGESPE